MDRTTVIANRHGVRLRAEPSAARCPGAECWRLILSPVDQNRDARPIFIRERVGQIVGPEMQDDENA